METAAAATAELSRILVLQLCPIGDTLFGTPALRALRGRFPSAHITVVTWASNRDILAGNPHVDEIVTVPGALKLPKVLRRLAEQDFDAVVGLSNMGSWLTIFTSARVRVGFNSQTLGWLYTAAVPDRRDRHAVDYCLDVVAVLGARPLGRHLEIFLSEQDRQAARRLLETLEREARPAGGQAPLRVAMHPGGRYFPLKRWSPAGFAHVADYLAGQYRAQVVLVGGPDDVPLAQAIVEECRLAEPLVAAGRTTLKQTAALIELCDLFVGNDSAPTHLAVAVGTPVVALFGPTSVTNFRPLGPHDVVVRKELPCSPCFRWLGGSMQHLSGLRGLEGCPECMRLITPQDVIAAIERQLDRLNLRRARQLERPAGRPGPSLDPLPVVACGPAACPVGPGRPVHKVQELDDW
ncbi:MAG TPA: glycosyltransferase family 9 protein [Limnochordales bacterium]